MKPLLIKPHRFAGESWAGYLLRLASANHLDGIAAIARMSGLTDVELLTCQPSAALGGFGIDVDSIDHPAQPLLPFSTKGLFRVGRSRFTSFCPACARENACWHHALGDLPLQLYCPLHACRLQRTCSSCEAPISALRRSVTGCDCGHPFALTKTRPAAAVHQVIAKILGVDRCMLTAVPTFAAADARDIDAVRLIQYLAHVSDPAWIGTGKTRKPPIMDAWVTEEQLAAASAWFEDWPASFEAHYVRLILSRRCRRSSVHSDAVQIIRGFPALNAVVDDLLKRRRRSSRPKAAHTPPRDFFTLKELMLATGMHYTTIRLWMDLGNLGEVTSQARGAQLNFRIPREQALAAIDFIKSTSSVAVLAQEVGLSTSALNALAMAGCFDAAKVTKATYTARLKPHQVYAMVADVLARVRGPLRKAEPVYTLSQALLRARRISATAPGEMLTQITEGVVEAHRTDRSDTTLSTVVMRRNVLASWLRSRRD